MSYVIINSQNAYAHLRKGKLPNLGLKPAEVAALKAGGKSVEELTGMVLLLLDIGCYSDIKYPINSIVRAINSVLSSCLPQCDVY